MNLMAKKTNFQPVVESRIQSRNFRPTAGTLAEQTQGQNMSMEKNGPMTVEVEKKNALRMNAAADSTTSRLSSIIR
jgi:hypothetical protein